MALTSTRQYLYFDNGDSPDLIRTIHTSNYPYDPVDASIFDRTSGIQIDQNLTRLRKAIFREIGFGWIRRDGSFAYSRDQYDGINILRIADRRIIAEIGRTGPLAAVLDEIRKNPEPLAANLARPRIRTIWSEQNNNRFWLVGDHGVLARVGRGRVPTIESKDTGTTTTLRSLWFSADGKTGIASSGWNDGNDEGERPLILRTTDGGENWERLSYRELPAPWVLGLVLPGLFFSAYGAAAGWLDWRRLRPSDMSVADEAASDRPIGWEDRDVLGLGSIAHAISRFLRNRNTDPPVTFAVVGPWGSGKSSLLNLVADDLRDFNCRPVWFNAWHHQKEQHLLAALLENIRTQAVPVWWCTSGLLFRVRLLGQRAGRLWRTLITLLILSALLATVLWLAYRLYPGEAKDIWEGIRKVELKNLSDEPAKALAGIIATFGTAGAVVYAVFTLMMKLQVLTLNPAKLMASLSGSARTSDLRDQLSFRHRFAAEFGEVCRALRAGELAGMVILIDDLDRCRPENVLEMLEAVNFLTTAGPCFVILAIDEEKVTSAVAAGFRELDPNAAERGRGGCIRRGPKARSRGARRLRPLLSDQACQHQGARPEFRRSTPLGFC